MRWWPFIENARSRGTPPTRFVVLFPGRTGSSWLVSSLGAHPQVTAEGERLVRRSPRWQRRWVERLYERHGRDLRAVGFKTKLKDVWDLAAFGKLLDDRSVRPIVLTRRNRVKQAVSVLNARRLRAATGRWNRRAGTAPLPAFAIAPADLDETIEACRAADDALADFVGSLRGPTLELQYEDLLADAEGCFRTVLDFLDVPPAPLTSDVVKNTDDDLCRVLSNYEALREHLAGGPYRAMLSE
jgi:LPS sulfotransferase NodH